MTLKSKMRFSEVSPNYEERTAFACSKLLGCKTEFPEKAELEEFEGYLPVKIEMLFDGDKYIPEYTRDTIKPFIDAASKYGITFADMDYVAEYQDVMHDKGYFIGYVKENDLIKL